MRGFNSVYVVGRVGQDPELRLGKSGTPWCSLSVATHRRSRDAQGEWGEETDWHDVRVFGDDAVRIDCSVGKGCTVVVEGSLAYDVWIDEEGKRRRRSRILARRIRVVAQRPASAEATGAEPEAAPVSA